MARILFILQILYCFIPLAQSSERQLQCKVVGIADGDTLTCLHNNNQLKIRLQYIDAPESGQPYGQKSKQALANAVFKKQVTLQISGYDRYNRLLAVVWDNQQNINLTLVEQGMAWAYRQTKNEYRNAEQIARQKRLGLWQDKNPIEPAEWRASQKSSNSHITPKHSQTAPVLSNHINCNIRKSCAQFNDYATALHHFQQCGWKELDGNNDGIPCNKLYRKAQQR